MNTYLDTPQQFMLYVIAEDYKRDLAGLNGLLETLIDKGNFATPEKQLREYVRTWFQSEGYLFALHRHLHLGMAGEDEPLLLPKNIGLLTELLSSCNGVVIAAHEYFLATIEDRDPSAFDPFVAGLDAVEYVKVLSDIRYFYFLCEYVATDEFTETLIGIIVKWLTFLRYRLKFSYTRFLEYTSFDNYEWLSRLCEGFALAKGNYEHESAKSI